MASFPTSFIVGSASSARSGVRDALQSYRRAQYLVAGSTVAQVSDTSDFEDDEEAQVSRRPFFDVDASDAVERTPHGRDRADSFIGQLAWDEDYDSPSSASPLDSDSLTTRVVPNVSQGIPSSSSGFLRPPPISSRPHPPSKTLGKDTEETPLLVKKASRVSFHVPVHPTQAPHDYSTGQMPRRASAAGPKEVDFNSGGQSTFGQTLFNSIAILLGIGMLSEPLAFAYAGWVFGTALIISYGFVACYTAKILAHLILADPRIRSYSDIGRKAFGPKVTPFISFMFCLELFSVSVVLVTLYGDSLHSLFPQYSSNTLKVLGTIFFIPTVFLPLSLLSYTSILGILSTVTMVVVVLIDGLSKHESPGSLWSPAVTSVEPASFSKLGLAFGLFMAGFSGHAVIPSLARDMRDPSQFDTMINWAFVVATGIYTLIGVAGYLMFGNDVSDEISVDLLATPGYNPLLNTVCLWLLVISPLSKFALNTQPLNATIEILLGIDIPMTAPEDLASKPDGLSVAPKGSHFGKWKRSLSVAQRILLSCFSVFVSISIPEFSSMMAFLGSFSAFLLSIVGPVLAKVMIDRHCSKFDASIIMIGCVMAVWGTAAAIL